MNILKKIKLLIRWGYVRIYMNKYYDRKYLETSSFSTIDSDGWKWAALDIWCRRKFGVSGGVRWPISPYSRSGPDVDFDPEDVGLFFQFGNYFQTINAKIHIGKGCYFARNIGIITTNHNLNNPEVHQPGKDVYIGDHCWIGMNVMILPGVKLGAHTVVGAGSVVTGSFEEGYCVIAGNPAKVIKQLNDNIES